MILTPFFIYIEPTKPTRTTRSRILCLRTYDSKCSRCSRSGIPTWRPWDRFSKSRSSFWQLWILKLQSFKIRIQRLRKNLESPGIRPTIEIPPFLLNNISHGYRASEKGMEDNSKLNAALPIQKVAHKQPCTTKKKKKLPRPTSRSKLEEHRTYKH